MFHDEDPFIFKKISEFSTVDGFVEVGECVADMIKYVANEPSLGLYYIQQHIQSSVPNLTNLKNDVAEKSHEMTLHTEDSDDSVIMIRSMRECGYLIAADMIRDITNSLAIMTTKQPRKGLIRSSSSSFKRGIRRGTSFSWGGSGSSSSLSSSQKDDVGTHSYLSNVMRSTSSKLTNFRWPQIESKELSIQDKCAGEGDELPLSSQVSDEIKALETDQIISRDELRTLTEDYDEFKADKEANLMEWLGEGNYGNNDKEQVLVKDQDLG